MPRSHGGGGDESPRVAVTVMIAPVSISLTFNQFTHRSHSLDQFFDTRRRARHCAVRTLRQRVNNERQRGSGAPAHIPPGRARIESVVAGCRRQGLGARSRPRAAVRRTSREVVARGFAGATQPGGLELAK